MKNNALIITNKIVFPPLDGGAMAMKKMAELLVHQNYNLDIVCIEKNNTKKTHEISKISKNINQIICNKNMGLNLMKIAYSILSKNAYQSSRFYDDGIKKMIQDLINKYKYKLILFESVFTTIYLDKLKFKNTTKVILRAHNVEHKIWEDLAKNTLLKKIPYLVLSNQIKKTEQLIARSVDHIFTLSTFDQEYFSNIAPQKTHYIPVTFDVKNNNEQKIKNSIVHLAAMDWKPNQEGLNWFIKHVLPRIRESNEKINVYIAGKNMPKKYFKHNNSLTFIKGKVEDAQSFIKNKEMIIVPLFSGSGIRIKILEGMSMGIPIISTKKGAEGIPYTHSKNIFIADTPAEFKKAISLLIEDKQLAKKIGNNGKKLIENYFSKSAVIDQLKKILNEKK